MMSAKDVQLDAQLDAQLELKKRARRRLVGAIALAVLAAIVLPMVMDQEPKPTAQDIQIRIPNQDAGSYTSRILPLNPGATATPLPAVAPNAKPAEAPKPASGSAPSSATEPKPAADIKPTPAKTEKAVDKSAEKAVEKPIEKAAEKPAEKSDKATAMPNDKAEKAKLDAALNGAVAEQWVVQLGAYRDPANVRNLQAKLKAQGYTFYTEALDAPDGSKKTRVRAGPFPNKDAAEKARERIKRIGVDGVVAQKQ